MESKRWGETRTRRAFHSPTPEGWHELAQRRKPWKASFRAPNQIQPANGGLSGAISIDAAGDISSEDVRTYGFDKIVAGTSIPTCQIAQQLHLP